MRISEEKQGIQKNVQMMKTKLASNAEWYTLCDFAPQNCLLVGGPQSPGTAPYRSWLRVSTKRFDAGIRPAENCIMEMCITGHSTDGKHHSQSMEKFLTFPHPANSVSHSFIYQITACLLVISPFHSRIASSIAAWVVTGRAASVAEASGAGVCSDTSRAGCSGSGWAAVSAWSIEKAEGCRLSASSMALICSCSERNRGRVSCI